MQLFTDRDQSSQNQVSQISNLKSDLPSKKENSLPKYSKWLKLIFGIMGAIVIILCFLYFSSIKFPYKSVLHSMKIFPPYTKHILFYPELQLPINFIWIGPKPLPQKYSQRLKKFKFPYKVLGEEQYSQFKPFFNFSDNIKVVQRSDAFRLAYLWKYGGVYSDFDNIIDYQCVMMRLQGLNGTYYAMEQNKWRQPTINFIYSSQPGDPILYQVIKVAHQRQNNTPLNFLFSYMQRKYQFDLKSIDLDQCVYHEYDATWMKN